MSASFAATERQAPSGPRIVSTTVTAEESIPSGFFGKVKGFFSFIWRKIRSAFNTAFTAVKSAVSKVYSFIPAPVRRFIPGLSFLPLAFSATWRALGRAFTWLWTHVFNKPWMWLMSLQVRLTAYAVANEGTWKGWLAKIGSYVAAYLPFVVPVLFAGLALFKVIGVGVAIGAMVFASPLNATLLILGSTLGSSELAWFGRGAVVLNIAVALLGGPIALVWKLTAAVALLVTSIVGVVKMVQAARVLKEESDDGEAIPMGSPIYTAEQGAQMVADAEAMLSEAVIVSEVRKAKKDDDKPEANAEGEAKSEAKQDIPVSVNVVPSKLSKGFDRTKVPHVPEGHDVNLKTAENVRWEHGIAYIGDRPVACDLRPGLKASQRDGRRKAFSDAFVAYLAKRAGVAV